MKIKSVLVWPKVKDGGPCLGWADSCENKSEDTHDSEYAAKCICEKLLTEGFGCEGRICPVEARVEVDGKVVYRFVRGDRKAIVDEVKHELRRCIF